MQFLASVEANTILPELSIYFKSPIGSLPLVFDLTYFQKCLEFPLHALAISF